MSGVGGSNAGYMSPRISSPARDGPGKRLNVITLTLNIRGGNRETILFKSSLVSIFNYNYVASPESLCEGNSTFVRPPSRAASTCIFA